VRREQIKYTNWRWSSRCSGDGLTQKTLSFFSNLKKKKVGDFSAQAVINTILSQAFPEDPIVGEEDATDLRAPNEASRALCARVVELADDILAQPPRPASHPSSSPPGDIDDEGEGERAEWGLGRRWGADALLKAIDRGSHAGGLRSGRESLFVLPTTLFCLYCAVVACTGMWTLDPIDGTKGFLRGGQYAVCLALLIDARVELGVIGCPNLPWIPSPLPSSYQNTSTSINENENTTSGNLGGKKGVLFVAVRGQGAHQLPLVVPARPPSTTTSGSLSESSDITALQHGRFRLNMPRLALHELSFLESFERAHAALDTNARVAARLGVRAAPVRMDSQAKYAALVRGDGGGGVYLRLPVVGGGRGGEAGGYQEKIWVR
jgi:3'-phosphoadenosine 5'-phosphosulfate (PAPS) 3'-phosphatase